MLLAALGVAVCAAGQEVAAPAPGEVVIRALTQEAEGPLRKLRGNVELVTRSMRLRADEIDYNEATHEAEARGNVHFEQLERGEELWADRVEYNLRQGTGQFHNVRGTSPARIEPRPGLLTSPNPFYFEGRLAERIDDRYVLYDGMVTNCEVPDAWWELRGPRFDVIPNQRALAHHSVFRLKGVPLFYTPFFYKSLERQPRKSGFLQPNLGNSSRRGKMAGLGYYWAPHRSYDAMYRSQFFTQRGIAHNVDVRGKPRAETDFNFFLYGVNDRGLRLPGGERRKEGGFIIAFEGRSALGRGFRARSEANYLSSLRFRQAFTESFNEAIFSEVHSIGFVEKHWSSFAMNAVLARNENFQSILPDDKIVIRRLPQLELRSRDRQVWDRGLPVWVSLESHMGLLSRAQPGFRTREFTERIDLRPRVMTAVRWKGFHLVPAFSVRETHYGQRLEAGRVTTANAHRSAREFTLDLAPPPLARTFDGPHWLGERVKHVIEPRASFRHARGVDDFDRFVRFDELELLSNTTEAEISITNRLYARRGGETREMMSWQLWQRRYFDTDFGGAVAEGRRNVVQSSSQLTPFAFLDRPRSYSPLVSVFRVDPASGLGLEFRSDYDPLRSKFTNGGFSADARFSNYFVSAGHNWVRSVPALSPGANQFRGLLGLGHENRRGLNAAFSAIYDYRLGIMQFATTQITYNTDCCGFSVQYRRFSFGTRNENQFRMAFSVANIGSFGTLKRQERLF